MKKSMKLDVKTTMNFLHSKGVKLPLRYLLLYDQEKITEEDLNIRGFLNLDNTPIKTLPKGLTIRYDLYLGSTPIRELPEGLKVGYDLWIRNTSIKELPEDLEVGNFIFVDKDKLEYFKEKYPKFEFKIKIWDINVYGVIYGEEYNREETDRRVIIYND